MNVLVDTSVWSLAIRRGIRRDTREVTELEELIREGRVRMIGPIRQELLSGVRIPEQFRSLREKLRAFPDLILSSDDYEYAATCFNKCRARGIQGSNTDFLICSVAIRRGLSVITTDGDFEHFAKVLPIKLHHR